MHGCPFGGLGLLDLNKYYRTSSAESQGDVQGEERTFWMSPTASQKRPIAKRMIPTISVPEPKDGLTPRRALSDTIGEFRMTTGSAEPAHQLFIA